jgi:hypothetical protein
MRDGKPFRISHVTEKKWNRWVPQVGPVTAGQTIKVWLLPLRIIQPVHPNAVTLACEFGKLVSAMLAELAFYFSPGDLPSGIGFKEDKMKLALSQNIVASLMR